MSSSEGLLHSITFRLARNDGADADRFCWLFNSLYARRVDGAYYRWQFFETPFPSVLTMALTEQDELAGCYGFHVTDLDPGGERVAWALDGMVERRFQGKGLFRELVAFAEAQVQAYNPAAVLGMANQRGISAHVHGLGWTRVNTLTTCVRDLSELPPAPAGRLALSFAGRFPASILPHHTGRNSSGTPLISNRRNAAFLQWRFGRNPWRLYDLLEFGLSGAPFGHAVVKIFADPVSGDTWGDVVDICWAKDDSDALSVMLTSAMHHLRRQGASKATAWLQTNTLLDQVGRDLGFVQTETKRYFCGKACDARYAWLIRPERWFITMADAELY